MKVNNSPVEKTIKFEDIYQGTILKCNNKTYLKAANGAAVDMESGAIVYPANDPSGGWDRCFIYPRASLDLK